MKNSCLSNDLKTIFHPCWPDPTHEAIQERLNFKVTPRWKNGEMITAICFAKKSQWILVGTYDGRCIVFETEKLAFYTEFKQASDRPVTGFLTKVIYL